MPRDLVPDDAGLAVYVQPRASRTGVVGVHGKAIKIRVAAPPVDGAANTELIRFLAKTLSVPRASVEIVTGSGSRHKRVRVRGLDTDALRAALLQQGGEVTRGPLDFRLNTESW
jgi:uncharacterized protein